MKKIFILSLALVSFVFSYGQQKDYTRFVNVFIGTGGHGHTFPGATMPYGMVQLSPDTRMKGWDACGGYYYADTAIYGFSHTHLSGTGIPDYEDILLMPTTGKYAWDQEDYKTSFSHQNEHASPGYYQVFLKKYHINVQLTATDRAGMHEYTFPASANEGNVLLDLHHGDQDKVLHSWLRVINDSTVVGLRESRGWANDQIVYFALKFSHPFIRHQLALDNSPVNNQDSLHGKNVKAYFTFDTKDQKTLFVKVALSAVSPEGAMENLNKEMPGFDFNKIRETAHNKWNKILGQIEVKGGTGNQRIMFYTALYHCYIDPNIYQDVDGKFRGTDLKIHQAKDFTNYTVFSLWDTYRALDPLMTILQPKIMSDWINTFLVQFKYGGMTPTWELSGNETNVMIGHHSVPVIVDAYQKGIRGFNSEEALAAIENYDESNRFSLPQYRKQGFLQQHDISESVSRTLEYSYDDWCIADMAKMLGKTNDYRRYIERAQFYKNVYDPSTGFFRGKHDDVWFTPFNPTDVNGFYTEANAWQYNFAAQQDVSGMIRLHGGREKFGAKLDSFFTTPSILTGNVPPDIAGMIGEYAHGDEPSHHIAYLFDYVGQPWRTQRLVHQVCNTLYFNDPNGESGNDDCGQMSAWLVMSAMGFYQVCPGRPEYALGTPMFDQVKVHLLNGRTFTVNAKNLSASDFYVQSEELNGKKYNKSYITHEDILHGATLTFNMGQEPNRYFATKEIDCPHSAITHDLMTPVPFIQAGIQKEGNIVTIHVGDADAGAVIYYTTNGSEPNRLSKKYAGTISLKKDEVLKMMAVHPGMIDSKVVIVPVGKM